MISTTAIKRAMQKNLKIQTVLIYMNKYDLKDVQKIERRKLRLRN